MNIRIVILGYDATTDFRLPPTIHPLPRSAPPWLDRPQIRFFVAMHPAGKLSERREAARTAAMHSPGPPPRLKSPSVFHVTWTT